MTQEAFAEALIELENPGLFVTADSIFQETER